MLAILATLLAGLGGWRLLTTDQGPGAAAPGRPECAEVLAVAWPGDGERLGCVADVEALSALAAAEAGCAPPALPAAEVGRAPAALPPFAPGDRLRFRPGAGGRCEIRTERLPGGALLTLGLPIALDEATADDLAALPGIGPKKARAIVAEREARGAFETVEALTRVRGIGPATVERLSPYLVPTVRRVGRGSGTAEDAAPRGAEGSP